MEPFVDRNSPISIPYPKQNCLNTIRFTAVANNYVALVYKSCTDGNINSTLERTSSTTV